MTEITIYETPGTPIVEAKLSPKGKKEKILKPTNVNDRKKLTQEAEKFIKDKEKDK